LQNFHYLPESGVRSGLEITSSEFRTAMLKSKLSLLAVRSPLALVTIERPISLLSVDMRP
jgi:hypothetical protein